MNDESALRAVLIVVMMVLLPVGMYHRISSQSTGEKLDRRQEGLFILATLRPLGAALWLAVFAWMINPQWMAWSSVPLPSGRGGLVSWRSLPDPRCSCGPSERSERI